MNFDYYDIKSEYPEYPEYSRYENMYSTSNGIATDNCDTMCADPLGLNAADPNLSQWPRDPYAFYSCNDHLNECKDYTGSSVTDYSSSLSSSILNSQNYYVTVSHDQCKDPRHSVGVIGNRPPVVKRRNTANKKERRRTKSINNAFFDLRNHIPNVPTDTKLSKIKTLRLANSYITFLMAKLNSKDPRADYTEFKADIVSSHGGKRGSYAVRFVDVPLQSNKIAESKQSKKRTGWPQLVWAREMHEGQQGL